jgi:preprotein translocase subunit YajC
MTSTVNTQVGDTVTIGGQLGTVTKVQHIAGLVIVSAASHKIESDGEGSLLIDVLELGAFA